MPDTKIRIGIDVGGTFTHGVAINRNYEVIAHTVTPTTHRSSYGVSEGIILVFKKLMELADISPENVVFVAHSTTQATNALLEGDVSKVGVIGMGKGLEALKAKSDTTLADISLAEGKKIPIVCRFLNTSSTPNEEEAGNLIKSLKQENCEVIVASEAFGVDDTRNENFVTRAASSLLIPAVAGSEITQLYGLKVRTKTAVINACILPKMTETARLTQKSVAESGIKAPLMIMRSDGGVMDIQQMEKRPILTMLSGPAAGIAAALMFAGISDGIFLEVGGTSTDISAIKNGKAMIKSATVGGHLTYLRTLDSKTVAIGGGSMLRVKNKSFWDLGPRSAHIAGLSYIAFSREEEVGDLRPVLIAPRQGDQEDYLVLENSQGRQFAVTLTDASIVAHVTREGDYAYGNPDLCRRAFEVSGRFLNCSPQELAAAMLDAACAKIKSVITELFTDYRLDKNIMRLVGGGGGATVVVPWLARTMNMQYTITQRAEVISAIGAALAMLRDTVEKNIINPTEDDILSIKKQAEESLYKMGANPETLSVHIEIDKRRNIVRATATGTTELRDKDLAKTGVDESTARKTAALSLSLPEDEVVTLFENARFWIFSGGKRVKKFFGLLNGVNHHLRVLSKEGIIKLQVNNARWSFTRAEAAGEALETALEKNLNYGDGGVTVPCVYLVYGSKIIDLSTIMDKEYIKTTAAAELKGLPAEEKILIITQGR
ncbi:MAG: hydantoinase/oxoprolinase [Treponema sp.]|nr:hydantoinase/oxoprolinase [Treponema sp.]